MSTWISRAGLGSLAALLLAACNLDAPTLPTALLSSSGSARGVSQTALAGGAVALTAPRGYCIDRRSVRRSGGTGFALLARCDTLGGPGAGAGRPLALIAVTSRPAPAGATPPGYDSLERAAAPARVLRRGGREELPVILIQTARPAREGVDLRHWRGAFMLNGQVIGISLYAPPEGAALGREGARLIAELAARTRTASASAVAAAGDRPWAGIAAPPVGPERNPFVAGRGGLSERKPFYR